jgi:hypothetical protein
MDADGIRNHVELQLALKGIAFNDVVADRENIDQSLQHLHDLYGEINEGNDQQIRVQIRNTIHQVRPMLNDMKNHLNFIHNNISIRLGNLATAITNVYPPQQAGMGMSMGMQKTKKNKQHKLNSCNCTTTSKSNLHNTNKELDSLQRYMLQYTC